MTRSMSLVWAERSASDQAEVPDHVSNSEPADLLPYCHTVLSHLHYVSQFRALSVGLSFSSTHARASISCFWKLLNFQSRNAKMSRTSGSTRFFHTCHVYCYRGLLPVYTTFTDLGLAWRSQGQRKAKPVVFIFLCTSWLIRIKFDMVVKQFKVNIQIPL